jgi:hypothetical protein
MPIEITGLFAAQRLCQELAIYPSGEILMYDIYIFAWGHNNHPVQVFSSLNNGLVAE